MTRTLYTTRREDVFNAIVKGELKPDNILGAGPLWMTVSFTEAEKANYSFPIADVTKKVPFPNEL
jgi:hypothetical protein